jgi:teichuronic acid biosynthesis glycosyltransferase TuaC
MKVLWTHNFNVDLDKNAGVFMSNAAKDLKNRGVDIQLEYLGNLRSPVNVIRKQKYIKKIAKDFDLVHAQYGSACSLVTSVIDSCPKILSLRGSDWNLHTASFKYDFWHTRIAKLMTQFSIKKYDHVLTVSNRMALELQNIYPKIHILSVPSPIDLSLFVPLKKRKARALLGYPNNKDKWVLFTACDIRNPIKRYSLAKAAVDLANAKLGNIRFRVAENIPHSEMPLFVAACDLILCTSDTEGWPNSIKEALACNLPFVSTDVSDLHEIADKEPSCRICSPDAAVIAENICDVLSNARNENLRRHVLEMDIHKMNKKLLNLYVDLASCKK